MSATKTKKLNDPSIPRVTEVPDSAVMLVCDAQGRLTPISVKNLRQMLYTDMLDGEHYGGLTAAYTHGGALSYNRSFTKTDNKGRHTYLLIADITGYENVTSGSPKFGFAGSVMGDRGNTTELNVTYVANVMAVQAYDSSCVLYSDNPYCQPCVVDYNSRVYIALRLAASRHTLYFSGRFWNCLSPFQELRVPEGATLPTGMTIRKNVQTRRLENTNVDLLDGKHANDFVGKTDFDVLAARVAALENRGGVKYSLSARYSVAQKGGRHEHHKNKTAYQGAAGRHHGQCCYIQRQGNRFQRKYGIRGLFMLSGGERSGERPLGYSDTRESMGEYMRSIVLNEHRLTLFPRSMGQMGRLEKSDDKLTLGKEVVAA